MRQASLLFSSIKRLQIWISFNCYLAEELCSLIIINNIVQIDR